jgi:hypothetical protein
LNTSAYVTQLYRNILLREPDLAGLNFWVGEITAGRQTRGSLLAQFSESAEFQNRVNDRMVASTYFYFMLNRDPDTGGLDWLTGELAARRLTPAAAANGFLSGAEYRARFY